MERALALGAARTPLARFGGVLSPMRWNTDDLDLVGVNEAFAAMAIASSRILRVSEECVDDGVVYSDHPTVAQTYVP